MNNDYKNNFVMLCKTYKEDLKRFEKMLKSFDVYNKDGVKLFVSVPEVDLELFKQFRSENIEILTDESYAKEYFSTEMFFGMSVGYVNQEICKLSFWETGTSENYLCIDSDVEFIRDFHVSDFMFDEKTPYTVLVMDKDLSIEAHYQDFWHFRSSLIKKTYDAIGLNDPRQRTCHGMQVLNAKVLKSLKNDFMAENGYDYKKLIEIAPYEFTWYNAWFQKCGLVKEYAVEPFFKTFHMRLDYTFSRLKMLKKQDLAKAYVGIIMNSNWEKNTDKYKKANFWLKTLYKILRRI